MKILFVSTHFPKEWAKSTTGTFQRMRMFVDALRERGRLKFLFYYRPELEQDVANFNRTRRDLITEWRLEEQDVVLCKQAFEPSLTTDVLDAYLRPIVGLHKQIGFARTSGPMQVAAFAKCLDEKPDLLFVHRLHSACPVLLVKRPLPQVFLDLDDIEHKAFLRELSQPPMWMLKRLCYLQWPALLLGERRAIRLAQKAFVCSELDARYFRDRLRLPNVRAIANAIRIPERGSPSNERTVLFLGTYGYRPNAVAAEILVGRIWPRIVSRCPEARLIIAGGAPESLRCYGARQDGVEYTGFVDDLDQLYARAGVVCCPIQSGGGTRVKIIEAAAYGKAVVSTSIGAEGLDFADGENIVIRDDLTAIADACVELLRNEPMRARIGEAARRRVRERYERGAVIRTIQAEIFGDVALHALAPAPADTV